MLPEGLDDGGARRSAPASAASTMDSAMRSLIEPLGLLLALDPDLGGGSANRQLMRMCGVLPMVCRDVAGAHGSLLKARRIMGVIIAPCLLSRNDSFLRACLRQPTDHTPGG